jgi:hypothetical protein
VLALCTFVTSMRSSIVSGGRIPGIRRASTVFPEPGGPLMIINGQNATHAPLLYVRTLLSAGEGSRVEVALI